MEAVETVETVWLETENVALSAPAGTVTLAGTLATGELVLPSVTTAPPVGAAPVRFTVPWEVVPPGMLVGLRVTDDSTVDFGRSISVVFLVEP
jgi:hypothetical protein